MSFYSPRNLTQLADAIQRPSPFHSTRFDIGAEFLSVWSAEGLQSAAGVATRKLFVPPEVSSLTDKMFADARAYHEHYVTTSGPEARHREPEWTYRYVWAWDEFPRKRRVIAPFLAGGGMRLDREAIGKLPARRREVVLVALHHYNTRMAGRIADTLSGEL